MKILIVSDSHRFDEILTNILEHETYDLVIHCGDSSFDKQQPLLKTMHIVRGNHDGSHIPLLDELTIEGYHILIAHGQTFDIYEGYEKLYQYMKEHHYDICFHGHTHVPHYTQYHDKLIINPGSTMMNRASYGFGTYLIVQINDHHIDFQFHRSDTLEPIDFSLIEEGTEILEEFKKILHR